VSETGRVDAPRLPEHAVENRAYWNGMADAWVGPGERGWAQEPSWGIWQLPEAELGLLPADMTGTDAVELGCGTGYVSSWMARRGATVTGVDLSERQLATARRLAADHGVDLRLLHASAESVPCPDASFDFAVSEYGAALWCDPRVWVPEAHRLLRPGGQLVLLSSSTLAMVCTPPDGSGPCTERLERDYFGLDRVDWRDAVEDPGGIEFGLPVSSWFRLFRETGFVVEDFLELRAPEASSEVKFFVSADWAHRFPSEQVWKVRKRL
jgi:SAM-dependent methyltransferase